MIDEEDDIIEIIPVEDETDRPDVYDCIVGAKKANLKYVLIIGADDKSYYFASSDGSTDRAVFMINKFMEFLSNNGEEE